MGGTELLPFCFCGVISARLAMPHLAWLVYGLAAAGTGELPLRYAG